MTLSVAQRSLFTKATKLGAGNRGYPCLTGLLVLSWRLRLPILR